MKAFQALAANPQRVVADLVELQRAMSASSA
jgi:hypothetical protein